MLNKPTTGRVVIYRTDGRNGLIYDLPAMVTCTRDSHPGDYPDGSKNPLPVPESDMHVHLTVFTPGGWGTKVGTWPSDHVPVSSKEFVGAKEMKPGTGTYVELNVPFHNDEARDADPRTWRWPVIK